MAGRVSALALLAGLASGAFAQQTPPPLRAEPTRTVTVPDAAEPMQGPIDAEPGPAAYRPLLPEGTPDGQADADPTAPVTTLATALQRAYWTHPQLLAERARVRAADFRLPQARGQYGPQLQYNVTYGYLRQEFELFPGALTSREGWTRSASAVLNQPLFTFGRLRANEDGARAVIAFQRASLRATEQEVLLNAISAYAAVLRDRAGVDIAADNSGLLNREFGDTRTRFEARESTVTDFRQVEARLELARAQWLTAQAAAANSDANFLSRVGSPAGELAPPNPLAIPVTTLEDGYVYAEAHNPVIASAYARERSSRAALEAAKAEELPRIDLRGQATLAGGTPYTDPIRPSELRGGITVSGTLDSGVLRARIDEAAAANDADWRLIDGTIRDNRAELALAWNAWKAQAAAVERLRIAVDAAGFAYEGGLEQQRAGLRTTLEILELARNLLDVRSSLNSAQAEVFVAQARVLSALGALEQRYLLPDAERYDPMDHFERLDGRADTPLLTPLIRALDSATTVPHVDRPVRDPAAPVAINEVRPGLE